MPSPHGTSLSCRGARHAETHPCSRRAVTPSRAQSDSAGLRLVRPPVGRETGTSKRVAKADIRAFDAAHNFDCWDTTRNDTSLLPVLQKWGALRHHSVGNPRYRGNVLVGQLQHNTAVIVERKRGTKWVVDMWPTAYGQVPDVMPLAKWLEEK